MVALGKADMVWATRVAISFGSGVLLLIGRLQDVSRIKQVIIKQDSFFICSSLVTSLL